MKTRTSDEEDYQMMVLVDVVKERHLELASALGVVYAKGGSGFEKFAICEVLAILTRGF